MADDNPSKMKKENIHLSISTLHSITLTYQYRISQCLPENPVMPQEYMHI